MNFIKKILPLVLVSIFIVALYYAIYMHIDGFGIFSIVLGTLFLLYGLHKTQHTTSTGIEKIPDSNISHTLKFITSPMFLKLVFTLLPALFSFLEKNRNRLDRGKVLELESELKSMLEKFKDDLDPESEITPDNHKSKKH